MRTKPWIGRKLLGALFGGIPTLLMIFVRIIPTLIEQPFRSFRIVKWFLMILNHCNAAFIGLWMNLLDVKILHIGDDPWPCATDSTLLICNHQSELDSPLTEMLSTSLYCYPAQIVGDNGQWYVRLQQLRGLFVYKKGDQNISQKFGEYMKKEFFRVYDWLIIYPEGGLFKKMKEKSDQYAIKNNLPIYKNVSTPKVSGFQTVINSVGETKEEKESGKASGPRIKWVLDVTIVYNRDGLDLWTNLHRETVPEDAAAFIITKLYPASEIPRGDSEMKQWLFDRFQEKDEVIEQYNKTGEIPKIEGIHTPFPPRPFAYTTIWFSFALTTYAYLLHSLILSPLISLVY